ncbi:hypothetical protein [Acidovorax sp. NCPPB 3576]|uniref:hypothetical protein n=1 Tax=Acidovorax sp. NCPPB 3576 TaxID=2940488 RepID=UPI00234B2BFC|nr:hypothetical protein [Acidovorax sp. NCPPB 3576]WCM88165.1 hypothetical protein M5C98_22970 [Acidovorax sp. NCPPB 3576]
MAFSFRSAACMAVLAAAAPAFAQSVLYTARPAIGLSVSDKMATRQPRVEFTVTMPDGKTTTATTEPQGGGERAGTVHYPSDFGNAGTRVGDYTWVARIGGKVVLDGRFSYRPTPEGQLLFVPR